MSMFCVQSNITCFFTISLTKTDIPFVIEMIGFGSFWDESSHLTVLVCYSVYYFMNLIYSSHYVKLNSSLTSPHWLHTITENNYVSFKTFCAKW